MGAVGLSVQEFISYFGAGPGRPNRFRVEFNMPPGVGGGANFVNLMAFAGQTAKVQGQYNSGRGAINIMCNQATLPQRSLITYGVNQNSAEFRVPYSASYDPVTFTFYADSTLNSRTYFEIWQSTVQNIQNNSMNYPSEFVADVHMYQMDSRGNDTYYCKLIEAWPMAIGSVELSMSAENQIHNTTVTMAYKYWTSQNDDDGVNKSTNTQPSVNASPPQT